MKKNYILPDISGLNKLNYLKEKLPNIVKQESQEHNEINAINFVGS